MAQLFHPIAMLTNVYYGFPNWSIFYWIKGSHFIRLKKILQGDFFKYRTFEQQMNTSLKRKRPEAGFTRRLKRKLLSGRGRRMNNPSLQQIQDGSNFDYTAYPIMYRKVSPFAKNIVLESVSNVGAAYIITDSKFTSLLSNFHIKGNIQPTSVVSISTTATTIEGKVTLGLIWHVQGRATRFIWALVVVPKDVTIEESLEKLRNPTPQAQQFISFVSISIDFYLYNRWYRLERLLHWHKFNNNVDCVWLMYQQA